MGLSRGPGTKGALWMVLADLCSCLIPCTDTAMQQQPRERSLGKPRTPPRTPGATAAARPLSSLGTEVATPTLGCLVDLRVGRRHMVDPIRHQVAGHHANSSGNEPVGRDRHRHHLGADKLAGSATMGCRAPGRTLSQQRCRAPRRHGHRAHGHHSSRSPSSRPRGTPTRSSRRVRRWSELRTTPARWRAATRRPGHRRRSSRHSMVQETKRLARMETKP